MILSQNSCLLLIYFFKESAINHSCTFYFLQLLDCIMNTNIISAILVLCTACMVQSQSLRAGLFGNRGLLGSRANALVCICMVIMAVHCRAHFSKVALVLRMILGLNLFTVLRHHTRFKGEIYQKSNFFIGLITVTSLVFVPT